MIRTFIFFILLLIALNGFSDPPHNVLLISIDTLRADHLGSYGSTHKTPAIDAIATRGKLYENVISQVPLTLPSHSTIMTGEFPSRHGIKNNENFALGSTHLTLAEMFTQSGYRTGGFVGSFVLSSSFGISQGFQHYDDKLGPGKFDDNPYVERRAESVWASAKEWLQGQKGPWFCFLHFYDPHTQYNPPKGYPQTYDGEVSYIDDTIEKISAFLAAEKLLNRTFVILLSDHGEALGEHGESSHGIFLYDSVLKVPLIMSGPGISPSRIPHQVRLLDVAPTIAHLAGVKPSPQFQGIDVINIKQSLPAYSETYYSNLLLGWAPLYSMRSAGKKYIHAPKAEFFDLVRDPTEQKNLFVSAGSVPPGMMNELRKHIQESTKATPEVTALSSEEREKLASLGYITGGSSTAVTSDFDPKDGIHVWRRIEAGVNFSQVGQLDAAALEFQAALKEQPENVLALKFLAAVHRKQNAPEKAIPLLKKALENELHKTETKTDLAKAIYEAGNFVESLNLFSSLISESPQNNQLKKMAAFAAAKSGQYVTAEKYFEQYVAKNEDPEALSLFGSVLSHLQRDQKALSIYKRLEKIGSLKEEEALQVAAIYLTAGSIPEAEQYFRLAVNSNAKSVKAWKGLALIYSVQSRWDQALEAFVAAGECAEAAKILRQNVSPASKEMYRNRCRSGLEVRDP